MALRARIVLRAEPEIQEEVETVRDLVDWELVLTSGHIHSALDRLRDNPVWQEVLPDLLSDFSLLLRDALDLSRELRGANDRSDRSYVVMPSISDHPQNRSYRDWTALIELTRDAWMAKVTEIPLEPDLSRRNGGWSRIPCSRDSPSLLERSTT